MARETDPQRADKVMQVLSSREAQATRTSIAYHCVSAPSYLRDRSCGNGTHLEILERIEDDHGPLKRLGERQLVQPHPDGLPFLTPRTYLVTHPSYHTRSYVSSPSLGMIGFGIRVCSLHLLCTRYPSLVERGGKY